MAALAKPAPAGAWPVAEAAGAAAVADLPKLTAKYAEELSWKRHNKFACNFWLSSEARLVESAVIKTAYDAMWQTVFQAKLDAGGWAAAAGEAQRVVYCQARTETCNLVAGPELMWSPSFVKTRGAAEARDRMAHPGQGAPAHDVLEVQSLFPLPRRRLR